MALAVIFDCEGARASDAEKSFFREIDPFGFIVFARHCDSADELRAHCDELRECVGRDAPILVDQEGGRVARMKPPSFPAHPAPALFGELWKLDREKAAEAAHLNGYLLGRMASDCGVNINCAPMLDVPQPDADPAVIGDRAIAKHKDIIVDLARAMRDGLIAGGVGPVIKHLPGHGRALCDSHYECPRVGAAHSDLADIDFAPFRALNDTLMGMTGHVVYDALDADHPATTSRSVVGDIIRGEIGYDGLLFSDDLKMQALEGTMDQRVRQSLDAGCDIALCCNFDMAQKQEGVKGAGALSGKSLARAERALSAIVPADKRDTKDDYAKLAALLKPVTV